MLSTFKKIAIGTLIAAPVVADLVARSLPGPAAPTELAAEPSAPAPAPPPATAPIKPITALPAATGAPSLAGIDPTPTLDPNALAAGIPAAAPQQALPRPQPQPLMPQAPQIAQANAPVAPAPDTGDFQPAPSERINRF